MSEAIAQIQKLDRCLEAHVLHRLKSLPIRRSQREKQGALLLAWIPIIALPNVNVQNPIEGNHAAIVGYYDKRLARLRGEHPPFKRFLSCFRDDFGRIQRPSALLLNEDRFEVYAQSEAVSAFRDLASICVVPYNRAWALKHGMRGGQEPMFSNSFAFYPWMIDRHYKGLIASTRRRRNKSWRRQMPSWIIETLSGSTAPAYTAMTRPT
jgi:hypothetical protein